MDEVSSNSIELLSPEQESMVSSDQPLLLEWGAASNTTHYLVHLTFLPYFSIVYDEYIVEDTFLLINNLLPNKNYRWRVRPYNTFHTCVPFSGEGQFSTGVVSDCIQSTIIGTTTYDIQTNASVCNRISQDGAGNVMATWIQSFDVTGTYPDRGTGYNRFDAAAGAWENIPTERLESNIRTGWPNHVITENGTELIINHVFTSQGVVLKTFRRTTGNSNWVESQVPSNTPNGVITSRMTSSGETVHVIAVTLPISFGGIPFAGVDGHILYYRSTNGGATWETFDQIIPGLDSSYMKELGFLDCYAIDARDNNVSIGVFSYINDVRIFKSADAGNSWTNTRIHDFPIDMYQLGQGYNINDLPPVTPQQPNPFAIHSTDNSGNILIDKNGLVHAFYGQMYLQDNLTNSSGRLFFETDGIAYWNESFGADSTQTIAQTPDLNGNGIVEVEPKINLGSYPLSMTTNPSPAVDENNNLYLAYSSIMEGPEYRQNEESQQYRHIMIIHSQDEGNTWSVPFDVIEATCINNPDILYYTEAMYPSMVRDIEDEILFIYQQDFDPGNSTTAPDPAQTNFIRFVRIDINELGVVETDQVVEPELFKLRWYPNPTTDLVALAFELKASAQAKLNLYNVMGQPVLSKQVKGLAAGENKLQFDLGNLPPGIYLTQLKVEDKAIVSRLVVQ